MSAHRCCELVSGSSGCKVAGTPGRTRMSRPAARRGLDIFRYVLPGAILILLPKCPLCLAAYIAIGTGVGLSMAAATTLRLVLIFLCIASIAFIATRHLYTKRSSMRTKA